MRKPQIDPDVTRFQEDVRRLWGKHRVFVTTAPVLADMEVGDIAIGSATEAAPAASSHAMYFKESAARIVVISTNGVTVATRYITS